MQQGILGWLGFEKSTFSKKKELDKLKKIFTEVKWRDPSPAETEGFTKISPQETIVIVAVTTIREIGGIIDNRLRVFDFLSPEHFIFKKFTSNAKSEKDDYVIGFTDAGHKLLLRKGLKAESKA